jgi:hypothetical protein
LHRPVGPEDCICPAPGVEVLVRWECLWHSGALNADGTWARGVLPESEGSAAVAEVDEARERWEANARERAAGIERVGGAIRTAVAEGRALDRGWPEAAGDLVDVLGELCEAEGAHPDLVDLAQSAVMALAGFWMPTEEAESAYLGEAPAPVELHDRIAVSEEDMLVAEPEG